MTLNPAKAEAAKSAFAQGIQDENNGAPSSRRLSVAASVRDFYDAARRQRAAQLAPERAAADRASEKFSREAFAEAFTMIHEADTRGTI